MMRNEARRGSGKCGKLEHLCTLILDTRVLAVSTVQASGLFRKDGIRLGQNMDLRTFDSSTVSCFAEANSLAV